MDLWNKGINMNVEKIYGGPGTGKTKSLLDRIENELRNGTKIYDISFLGYTRAACHEALERARKIAEFGDDRFWFMTIHATCLKLLRNNGYFQKVVSYDNMRTFCEQVGLDFPEFESEVILGDDVSAGIAFFSTLNYLVNTNRNPEQWVDSPFSSDLETDNYPELLKDWEAFKQENNLMDFCDMLAWTRAFVLNVPTSVLMVDEFQDLSPLQRDVIIQFMLNKKRIYIAGDDDQALYRFQGAEPEGMLDFKADSTLILDQSYRCPNEIFRRATDFISDNRRRQPKEIKARQGEGRIDYLDFPTVGQAMRLAKGSTYLLLRTNYLVSKCAWDLIRIGIPFRYLDDQKDKLLGWTPKKLHWLESIQKIPMYDRQKCLYVMQSQGKISKGVTSFLRGYVMRTNPIDPDRINNWVGTIHSAKGKEADTVILFDDITPRVSQSMKDPSGLEDERRVWYVGMTRAKYQLIVCHATFRESLDLPGLLQLRERRL